MDFRKDGDAGLSDAGGLRRSAEMVKLAGVVPE